MNLTPNEIATLIEMQTRKLSLSVATEMHLSPKRVMEQADRMIVFCQTLIEAIKKRERE